MTRSTQYGFTLIELVVTITISAVVVGFMMMFLVTPVNAYMAQSRRAELVTEANQVAHNMAADLRAAILGEVQYAKNGTTEVLQITPAAPNVPITYLCDQGTGTVTRYSNYIPAANIANRDSDAELMGANARAGLLARDVSFCRISYDAANPLHDRLIGLQLHLVRNGETMVVFRQMPLMN